MSKRRLDLGDGGLEADSPAANHAPAEERVDLTGEQQVIVYTHYLSRSFCPVCEARGMMTSRVNPVVTLFVCQQCLAQFEVEWRAGLHGTSIHVDQFTICPTCNGRVNRIKAGLLTSYCLKCDGYGRVRLPKGRMKLST